MRWAVLRAGEVTLVNDAYNANPLSMRAALQAFGEMPVAGARWLVLGGMREIGSTEEEAHRALGRDLAREPWAGLFVLGERGQWIASGARASGMDVDRITSSLDVEALVGRLADRVSPGDAVLFKASRGEALERAVMAMTDRLTSVSTLSANGAPTA
jgi:UDP-N-acetylmuramyl pentapeptide synthase